MNRLFNNFCKRKRRFFLKVLPMSGKSRLRIGVTIAAVCGFAWSAFSVMAEKPAPEPQSIGVFQDWEALKIDDAEEKLCWVSASPLKSDTAVARETPLFMVSRRPDQKVFNEVSYFAGEELVKENPVVATVDNQTVFNLSPRDSWAWIKDETEESRAVNVLKHGSKLVISVKLKSGMKINDEFSLLGFTAAYDAAKNACDDINEKASAADGKKDAN
jgi:hypothetical protein